MRMITARATSWLLEANLSKSKLDGRVSMFVGMDLHKNYLQIAVMNQKGKVLENSRINNNLKQVGGPLNCHIP
jgi:hypothetical protein